MWCEFCQAEHTASSCYHPGARQSKEELAALHQRKGELEQAISRVRTLPSYDGFLKIRMRSGMLTMAGPWVRLDDIKRALDNPPKF